MTEAAVLVASIVDKPLDGNHWCIHQNFHAKYDIMHIHNFYKFANTLYMCV